jgi:hypothetical protein
MLSPRRRRSSVSQPKPAARGDDDGMCSTGHGIGVRNDSTGDTGKRGMSHKWYVTFFRKLNPVQTASAMDPVHAVKALQVVNPRSNSTQFRIPFLKFWKGFKTVAAGQSGGAGAPVKRSMPKCQLRKDRQEVTRQKR